MNKIFRLYLDQLVMVYLDDIVIYNKTLEKHVNHLQIMFKLFKENQLHVKNEKCLFAKKEVYFLYYKIMDGKLYIDGAKVKVIYKQDLQLRS